MSSFTNGPVTACREFWGEVEGLSPTPFIQVSDEGVEFVYELSDILALIPSGALASFKGTVFSIISFDLLDSTI